MVEPTETFPGSSASTQPTVEPSPGSWRVDVINGPRRIIVEFNPDGLVDIFPSASCPCVLAWQVEPNAKVTLFDALTPPVQGSFDLLQALDDPHPLGHCYVFETVEYPAADFTILIKGDAEGPKYSATIKAGLPPLLPKASLPDLTVANCSG